MKDFKHGWKTLFVAIKIWWQSKAESKKLKFHPGFLLACMYAAEAKVEGRLYSVRISKFDVGKN